MASTVIVGSGVMGASVAYHLAARGHRDVLVLDRADGPDAGATFRAAGGFRAQHATATNVRLSLLAREKLLAFRRDTGIDPGYRTVGCLWLADTDAQLEVLRAGLALQQSEGLIEAMEVEDEQVAWLNPALDRSGFAGAVFCPTDGYIRPFEILRGYIHAATRLGVRFEWNTPVEGLERAADGSVGGVRTARGVVPADRVVNAAGAWAGVLGGRCGLEVPVVPLRRQVVLSAPTEVLPIGMPLTIFAGDSLQLRVRDGRVQLHWPVPAVPCDPFSNAVDEASIARAIAKARARVPSLGHVPFDRAATWAGPSEVTPDTHAVIGPHPECPSFLLASASGYGVMHAPALGHLLAEIVIDGRASALDTTCLRPGRFADGDLNPVSAIL